MGDKFTQFNCFWFVKSLGKTQSHSSAMQKKLEQKADTKSIGQLEQAKLLMEGTGWDGDSPGSSKVKFETEKAGELKKKIQLLKAS